MGETKGKILLFVFMVCFDMQTIARNRIGQKKSDKDNIKKKNGNEAGTSWGFFFPVFCPTVIAT